MVSSSNKLLLAPKENLVLAGSSYSVIQNLSSDSVVVLLFRKFKNSLNNKLDIDSLYLLILNLLILYPAVQRI